MVLTAPAPTEDAELDARALFEEAKARRRRRWIRGGFLAIVIAVLIVAAIAISTTQTSSPRSISLPGHHAGSAAPDDQTSSVVAWVDYYGNLHIGSPNGTTQRVVRKIDASPTTPLVSLAGRLFWAGTNCPYSLSSRCYSPTSGFPVSRVQEYDPSSNRLQSLEAGTAVFASADTRSILVVAPRLDCPPTPASCDPHAEQLTQIPVSGPGHRQTFDVPHGWYVGSGAGLGDPTAVTQGVLVQSEPAQSTSQPPRLGLWNLRSGRVRVLGRDWGIVASRMTAHGASYLAWLPGSCVSNSHCSLQITNTATFKSVSVRSPFPYGFDLGGAFSPSGRQLAVFVKTNAGDVNPAMQLAIANVNTGTLRLVPGVKGEIGESVGWAHWLPSGDQVLAGTFSNQYRTYNHYLVNTQSDRGLLVDFSDNRNLDVNFSSVIAQLPNGIER